MLLRMHIRFKSIYGILNLKNERLGCSGDPSKVEAVRSSRTFCLVTGNVNKSTKLWNICNDHQLHIQF
ncbi:hypothetical protein L484_001164 [Morus notabilis]|uniref:Uncharacterized protein n=1 Tax=Morus notabilis TaxID=981085 RepID=W9RSM2_9ROSA|nr:hypothetical protein L484_001164 [Morus notabilis]